MKRIVLGLLLAFPLTAGMLPAAAQPAADVLPLPALPAASHEPAPLHEAPGEVIDGSYIVVIEEDRDPREIAEALSVTPTFVYERLPGFAAGLDDDALERVLGDPAVLYVEEDQLVQAAGVQWNPPWGLDRIDQRFLPLDNLYHWTHEGDGINAFVFDTGIETGHWDFEGRARVFLDVFGGNGEDCVGHGTHIAGTIGGRNFGVAKGATLWSVRVLDCNGMGSVGGIIYATERVMLYGPRPAVANYSLVGGFSSALNAAVDDLAGSGVFVAAAAIPSGDACNFSPASAIRAMGVGATDAGDQRIRGDVSSPCIDVWAPGYQTVSAWLNGSVLTMTGTSPAAPHVAGTGALVLSDPTAWPPVPRLWILRHATTMTDQFGQFLLLYKAAL